MASGEKPTFTVRFWRLEVSVKETAADGRTVKHRGLRWKAEAEAPGMKPTAVGFGATPEQALAASCAPLASWTK